MTLAKQLYDYIAAAFTGLWVQTWEPDEAEKEIAQLAAEKSWLLYRWDIANGWGLPGKAGKDEGNPIAPLKALPTLGKPGTDATTIMLLHNYHRFLQNPVAVQELFNRLLDGKHTRTFVVILAPSVQIPPELEKVFVVLEHPLPDKATLEKIAGDLTDTPGVPMPDTILESAAGLTRYEAEGAFALSLARRGIISSYDIWELKASMLKKSGLLEMHRGTEKFSDLGGLDSLKTFCRGALKTGRTVQPKGVMLLGVPGTGKSAFAKALGNDVGRPTLTLDVGACYGSLVGETEGKIRQALKIADAMAPCVLFIDEIEKALSGLGGQGDSGVSTRLFGTLLTWLSDHTSDVFVIATSNDISKLPPEFARAERWDAVFFIDLPTKAERDAIWSMYGDLFNVGMGAGTGACCGTPCDDNNWTGAEIKACCRLAALLDSPLAEAAENVVPVATTAADKVTALREWASGRCLSASVKGIYHHNQYAIAPKTSRRTIAKEKV